MLKVIPIKCASCGGSLEITPDMESFNCGYCGAAMTVQRRGGTVALHLVDAIKSVQAGTDKTAAELAIKRLSKELADVENQIAQNNAAKQKDVAANRQVFTIIWLFLIPVSIIIGGQVEVIGGILAGIVFIGGTVACVFFAVKRDTVITGEYDKTQNLLLASGKSLMDKIVQNRKFVD